MTAGSPLIDARQRAASLVERAMCELDELGADPLMRARVYGMTQAVRAALWALYQYGVAEEMEMGRRR